MQGVTGPLARLAGGAQSHSERDGDDFREAESARLGWGGRGEGISQARTRWGIPNGGEEPVEDLPAPKGLGIGAGADQIFRF